MDYEKPQQQNEPESDRVQKYATPEYFSLKGVPMYFLEMQILSTNNRDSVSNMSGEIL